MIDKIFGSIITEEGVSWQICLICLGVSLVLGFCVALSYMFKNRYTQSFVIALVILPAVVQLLVMVMNDNYLGSGIAIAGAFSLVRFRSAQGSAREIGYLFISTATGIAVGAGYIGIAVVFTLVMIAVNTAITLTKFGDSRKGERMLRITIPESLDYTSVFDDLFAKYTSRCELVKIRTTNMGSLFRLQYRLELKDESAEKEFIDELRIRNGNLDIICGRDITDSEYSL